MTDPGDEGLPGPDLCVCDSLEELHRLSLDADRAAPLLIDLRRVPPEPLLDRLEGAREDLRLTVLVSEPDFARLRRLLSEPRCADVLFIPRHRELEASELGALALGRPPEPADGKLAVSSHGERSDVLAALERHARAADLGVTTTTYISLVADELLLNAMFSGANGDRPARLTWLREAAWASRRIGHEVGLCYERRGDQFLLQVEDSLGELTRPQVIEALGRSRLFQSGQIDAKQGLGLVLAMNLSERLSIRVVQGQRTTILAVLPTRGGPGNLRAIHLGGL